MSRSTIGPSATPAALHAIIEGGFNRGDADAVVAAYEDDAMLVLPPGGDLALGRHGIRAVTAEVLALEPKMTLAVLKRVESDEMAITHIRWRLSVTSPDGDRRTTTGRGTFVSRRRPDGGWGIVLDDLGFARPFRAVRTLNVPGRQHRSAPTADIKGSRSTPRALAANQAQPHIRVASTRAGQGSRESIGRDPREAELTSSSRLITRQR
jgi:uncharacterized protein (TIGR02246 family)